MSELDLFASELAGRKILVKERMNSKRLLTVHRQVAECQVVERKSRVEVLVENTKDRTVVIKPSEKYKLIRVHVEKQINDLDYQFAIPEDDDFIEDSGEYFEKDVVDALTTTDIVLKPKTYHTEICVAKLDVDYGSDPIVQVEKTKTSTMKIGMRRMILVPKVVTYIKMGNGEGRLSVKLYNASKSIMRISANTPIAGLRIQKPGVVGTSSMKVVADKRRRGVGEVQVTERYLQLKEEELVVLTWHERDQRWPAFARLNVKKGVARVAIGESSGRVQMNFPYVHSILHSQVQEQTTEFIFWRSPPSSPSSLFLSTVVKSLIPAGFYTKCGLLANFYSSIVLQLLEIYCCCKFDKSSTLGVIFQRFPRNGMPCQGYWVAS